MALRCVHSMLGTTYRLEGVLVRVAFLTIGPMKEPWGHTVVAGFQRRIPMVFDVSERSPGFVGSSRTPMGEQMGESCLPTCLSDVPVEYIVKTLSVWEDLESVFAFAYGGHHAEALKHRDAWFPDHTRPIYATWWISDDHIPTWAEAAERIDYLHTHGPTPFCFTFRQVFDAEGQPGKVDRLRALALRKPIPETAPA